MTQAAPARSELQLSPVVATLLKGVVYRDTHEKIWRHLIPLQTQVRDYVAVIGLMLSIDEAEGYAFLSSRPDDDDDDAGDLDTAESDGRTPIPRLVARRPLSFHVSLLLALLRKKLAEFDAQGADTRLVMSRSQIVDMLRVFLPAGSNDARLVDQIDAHISKVVELGFLRRIKDTGNVEVRRIIKAFVDAQWLSDFDERLARYRAELSADASEGGLE